MSLVKTLKPGEAIWIGDAKIQLLCVHRKGATLCITAPRSVRIAGCGPGPHRIAVPVPDAPPPATNEAA